MVGMGDGRYTLAAIRPESRAVCLGAGFASTYREKHEPQRVDVSDRFGKVRSVEGGSCELGRLSFE